VIGAALLGLAALAEPAAAGRDVPAPRVIHAVQPALAYESRLRDGPPDRFVPVIEVARIDDEWSDEDGGPADLENEPGFAAWGMWR